MATRLPLIGIGGISSLEHVLQFMVVGSCAVQIGTANFYDPTVSVRIVEELRQWCEDRDIGSLRELIATLQTPPEGPE